MNMEKYHIAQLQAVDSIFKVWFYFCWAMYSNEHWEMFQKSMLEYSFKRTRCLDQVNSFWPFMSLLHELD